MRAVVDRIGPRRAVVIDLLIVVGSAGGAAAAGGFGALWIACGVAGFSYALSTAGTNVAVNAAVAPERRGLALAVKTAGVPSQVVFGSLLGPSLGERFGWRPVIGALAIGAAVAACLAWWALPSFSSLDDAKAPSAGGSLPEGFVIFPLASFFLLAGTQPLFSWIVAYLHEGEGVGLTAAGRISGFGAASGVLGMITLAARSDRMGAARRMPQLVLLCWVCVVAALLLVVGTRAGALVGCVGFLVGVVAHLAAVGLIHASIADVAPHAVGRASGVTLTGYYLGALVAPWLFGWSSDRSDGFSVPWVVCALLCSAGALLFHSGRRMVAVS